MLTRRISLLAGIGAVALLALPAAAQQDFDIVSGQTETTTQVVTPGGSGIVQEGGTVDVVGDAIEIGDGGTVTVDGTVIGTNEGIDADVEDDTTVIIGESGSVLGLDEGIELRNRAYVENDGMIEGRGDDGIDLEDFGTVINRGTILGVGDGVDFEDQGTLVNRGTITGLDDGVDFENQGQLTNYGTIIGDDDGVSMEDHGRVENFGTIRAINDEGVDGGDNAFIVNHGTIESVFGEAIDIDGGTIINTGILRGDSAIDFDAGPGKGIVINSGSILATSGPTGSAISFNGGHPNELVLRPGSIIVGTIEFGAANDVLRFENEQTTSLTLIDLPELITSSNPFIVSGNTVTVFEPSDLAAESHVAFDLASGVHGVLNARRDAARAGMAFGQAPVAVDGGALAPVSADGEPGLGAWIQAFGGMRKNDDPFGPEVDHQFVGLVGGVDRRLGDGAWVGAFVGATDGDLETDPDARDIDIESYFAGAYWSPQRDDGSTIDVTVIGGTIDRDSERLVADNTVSTGLDRLKGDSDGYYVSPEIAYGHPIEVHGHAMIARARLRYTGYFLDGMTERGVNTAITVEDRDVHTFSGGVELAVPYEYKFDDGSKSRVMGYVGAQQRYLAGDADDVDVRVQGVTLSLDPGTEELVTDLLAGFTVGWSSADGRTHVHMAAEGAQASDKSTWFMAQFGVTLAF